jgi:hypothetical protein
MISWGCVPMESFRAFEYKHSAFAKRREGDRTFNRSLIGLTWDCLKDFSLFRDRFIALPQVTDIITLMQSCDVYNGTILERKYTRRYVLSIDKQHKHCPRQSSMRMYAHNGANINRSMHRARKSSHLGWNVDSAIGEQLLYIAP